MTDQNSGTETTVSGVERQIRPDEVMQEFNIKKDAYYDRIKFLGIKAAKGNQGKAYLSEAQFDLMKQLDLHIKEHGTMEGFAVSNSTGKPVNESATGELSDLALAKPSAGLAPDSASLLSDMPPPKEPEEPQFDQFESLFRSAAEIAGQRMVMPDLLKLELADRMTYNDLPPDIRARVDHVRESAVPKHQPSRLADQLMNQWRDRIQATAAATA